GAPSGCLHRNRAPSRSWPADWAKWRECINRAVRLKGRKRPAANMLVSDYLRVAANKAEVVAPLRTLGFHTFRRTLASVLVKMEVDPKLVQEMLRHQNLKTTVEGYARPGQKTSSKPRGCSWSCYSAAGRTWRKRLLLR